MEEEISLSELFTILKKNLAQIIGATLVGIIIMAFYTFFLVDPLYSSTTTMVVNDSNRSTEQIQQADINTNLKLISTYQTLVTEPIVLERAIKETGANVTSDQLRNMISVQTKNDSLVFSIKVTSEDPYMSATLANGVSKVFSEEITNILNVENVTILSTADANVNPVSPSIPMNLILGALIGAVIGTVIAFITSFTDKTVKDMKILEENGWTILGSIPEMTNTEITSTPFKNEASRSKLRGE